MVSVPSPFPQESMDEDIVRSVSDVTWLETVLCVSSTPDRVTERASGLG